MSDIKSRLGRPDSAERGAPLGQRGDVHRLMLERRSCRAFQDVEIPREQIVEILDAARFAPSGNNTQPWRVYVVQGCTRAKLVAALSAAFDDPEGDNKYIPEFDCYPSAWVEPYLGRRRQVGKRLYAMLGIGKGDKAAMHAQHRRNMSFFDAPVGMFFTIDRSLGRGSWLDCGMFIQNVMLAAAAVGLQTCPQAAFLRFHSVIRAMLGWPETETLLCGMALGYRQEDARENALVTERECVGSISRFFD